MRVSELAAAATKTRWLSGWMWQRGNNKFALAAAAAVGHALERDVGAEEAAAAAAAAAIQVCAQTAHRLCVDCMDRMLKRAADSIGDRIGRITRIGCSIVGQPR